MKEFGPEFVHLKGESNDTDDTNRLEIDKKASHSLCYLEDFDVTFSTLTNA